MINTMIFKKLFPRSGTEEEYGELNQLLEDISSYRRDMKELKEKEAMEKEQKKKKEAADQIAGTEMRRKAMEGLGSKHARISSSLCSESTCNVCIVKFPKLSQEMLSLSFY